MDLKYKFSFSLLLFSLSLLTAVLHAQDEYVNENFLRYEDFVYKSNIQTVNFFQKNLPLSYPVLNLATCDPSNRGDDIVALTLSFDDLDQDIKDYYYTVIHCDAAWAPSELNELEYIDGFTEGRIEEYDFSFNTLTEFTHYRVHIPNQDMCLTKSGNYLMMVFEDEDRENLVLTRRFMVVEHVVSVFPEVTRTAFVNQARTHHEIKFEIQHKDLRIDNPRNDLYVNILQNGRWDNALIGVEPTFIRPEQIVYNQNGKLAFEAGKEFRNIDARTFRMKTERVKDITSNLDESHLYLFDEESRANTAYFFEVDINGKFVVDNQIDTRRNSELQLLDELQTTSNFEGTQNLETPAMETFQIRDEALKDIHLESDYAYVHFSYKVPEPYYKANLYITGAFSNWTLNEKFRLNYDRETGTYTTTQFLKQGYYNYQYVLLKDGKDLAETQETEGNYYETENDYFIFVYYKPFGARYDRLIGLQMVDSNF